MWIYLCIMIATVILDQVSKALAAGYLYGQPSVSVIPHLLRWTYSENTGMAFGLLDEGKERWVFLIITPIAIVACLIYLWKFAPKSPWVKVGLSLVIGGGVGNMIDRVRLGYVVDFIDFYTIWDYIFNLADSFVCVGAGILFVWCLLEIIKEYRKDKKKNLQSSAEDSDSAGDPS